LVVDDSDDAADSLALVLTLWGHDARVAYDGPTALQLADSFLPQLVFLDLALPRMDGLHVARCLRQRAESRDAILIAYTGCGQDEDRKRCHEAGFDYFLLKPFDLAEVQRLLSVHAARRPAPGHSEF
jgi:DNA-binding response OmpR family regulator